jgi:hypothetical protein
MTLSDLAAIGSFVSGVAVVFSFVFLALQMRQTARNQRATVHTERTMQVQDLVLSVAAAEVRGPMIRGYAGDPSLSAEEFMTFVIHATSTLRLTDEFYLQHRDGMIDDTRWEGNAFRIRSFLNSPGFRAVWRMSAPGSFSPAFTQWMDGLYRETKAAVGGPAPVAIWAALAQEEIQAASAFHST